MIKDFFTKIKTIKLIKKIIKEENLKGWIITNFPEDFNWEEKGLDGMPFGATNYEKRTIYLATNYGIDFITIATTLLHEIAHIKDESWFKDEQHNENWACEFTSLIEKYMKIK